MARCRASHIPVWWVFVMGCITMSGQRRPHLEINERSTREYQEEDATRQRRWVRGSSPTAPSRELPFSRTRQVFRWYSACEGKPEDEVRKPRCGLMLCRRSLSRCVEPVSMLAVSPSGYPVRNHEQNDADEQDARDENESYENRTYRLLQVS